MTNENETDRSDGGIVKSKPKKKKSKKVKKNEVAFKDMLQRNLEEMIEQAPAPGTKCTCR